MSEDILQGSPEWQALRCGKLTASKMAEALGRTKTGWGAPRAHLMGQLIAERLTGKPTKVFQNEAMRWGTEVEPEAREAYEFRADTNVVQVGFVEHPDISMSGMSPDGLVGDDGLIEIKCPMSATHVDTLLAKAIPEKYEMQILWQLAVSGRAWCDFVSFDPRMPGDMQMFVKRLHRDDQRIAEMERDARTFLAELDGKVEALINLYRNDVLISEAA